jgi:hypothetical protein
MKRERTEWLTKMARSSALLIILAAAAASAVTTATASPGFGQLYCECRQGDENPIICGEAPECDFCSCMEGNGWECDIGQNPGYCVSGDPDEVTCECWRQSPPYYQEVTAIACWALTIECMEGK